MSAKFRRFVPRLEALDDRSLPSVTVTQFGTILLIQGDNAADTVAIMDNGQASGVSVQYNENNVDKTYFATAPVTSIVVDTLGGTDTVDYWLTGTLLQDRSVSANLGGRADTFAAHLSNQTITFGTTLFISAHGDGGGDRLTLDAYNLSTELDSQVNVDFSGGRGKDTITMNYTQGDISLGMVNLFSDNPQ